MKFAAVEIKHSNVQPHTWFVDFYDLEGDRVDENQGPLSFGVYYYSKSRFTKKEAFSALKQKLISDLNAKIAILTKQRDELMELEYPILPKNPVDKEKNSVSK